MQSTGEDHSKIIEIDGRRTIYSVFFVKDGKQVLSGGEEGIVRRWRTDDGIEAGEGFQAGNQILAAALSPDCKWLVCGLWNSGRNVRVWNAETHQLVLDSIDGHTNQVNSVDICSDSTKFATGGMDCRVFVWSMSTGRRLTGPLLHDGSVVGVRFSPKDDRLATATVQKSIRIFDSDNGQQLHDISCPFQQWISSPLAWSPDGRQLFAASASFNGVKCFDASSGSLLGTITWSLPGGSLSFPSVAPSSNQKFLAIAANRSLSLWDASTLQQIGTTIECKSGVYSMALSPSDDFIVTGEENGKIIWRDLRGFLPDTYLTGHHTSIAFSCSSQLPLLRISDPTYEAWTQGDLIRAENLLEEEALHPLDTPHHAQVLAYRAFVRYRSKQYDLAIDDAKKSIEVQRSTIGQVAIAIARAGNGKHDSAIRVFDLVFTRALSTENNLLLLIKAVMLFECGRHDDALSRIEDLIDTEDDNSMYVTVHARMNLLLGDMSLRQGDYEQATELLGRARDAICLRECPYLMVISLIFGWDFDGITLAVQLRLEQCMEALEAIGDAAMQTNNSEEAIARYSIALSLNPSNPTGLLVKRSKARGMLSLWEDALVDADESIKADPHGRWGYERRHAALYALRRYNEANDTLNHMLSQTEKSLNEISHCHCHYGDDAALCHLLEDIVACSGGVTALAWTGQSSSYNSYLPATHAIYNPTPHSPFAIEEVEMDIRVAALRNLVPPTDAILIHDRVARLPPIRFANRRLYLPCIAFPVKKLVLKDVEDGQEVCYHAQVSGIGQVEFQTSVKLSLTEPRKLVFVHPWVRDLCDPFGELGSGNASNTDVSESDPETEVDPPLATSPLYGVPVATMDDYTRGLRLMVQMQQPFRAFLLQQQPNGELKRVAAEHEIVVPGLGNRINSAKDIRVGVVEIA